MKKTVLITGAARGIGQAAARIFLQDGWQTVINFNHSEASARSLFAELTMSGYNPDSILLAKADVSRASDVQAMVEQAEARFGAIDVLINNAGVAAAGLFTDQDESDWEKVFAVNVKGAMLCSRAVLPGMIRRKRGCIINISSMWGQVGAACEVAYSASKGAIDAFTKALAKEVGPSGIRVNAISPGLIDTEMNAGLSAEDKASLISDTPLGVIGQPFDVAQAALFLASEQAAFITGQILPVNGGFIIT